MRKSNWKHLVALALAAAGYASQLRADEPEGVVALPPIPAPLKQHKAFPIREQTPVHFAADAEAQDPGVRNAGPVRYSSPLEAWIVDRNAVTYPPDYGWSRPVKRPVLNRDPVQYHRMDPDYWYGDPRAFVGAQQYPMVYMPSDTTQLGYYGQRVPTWQPNPNMIPAPPWPSTWHMREYPGYQRLHHPDIHRPSFRIHLTRGCSKCGGECNGQCMNGAADVSTHAETPTQAAPAPTGAAPKSDLPAGERFEKVPPKDLPSTQILFPGSNSRTASGPRDGRRS